MWLLVVWVDLCEVRTHVRIGFTNFRNSIERIWCLVDDRVEGVGSEVVTEEPVEGSAKDRVQLRKRRKLEAMCDEYLLSLHCTLWGQAFSVIHPTGRAEAVEWLADTLEALAEQERAKDA